MHTFFILVLLFSVNHCFGMEETERPTTPTEHERKKSPSCDSPEQFALQQKLDQEDEEEQKKLLALYPPLPIINDEDNNGDLRKKIQANRFEQKIPKDKKQPKKGSLRVRRSVSDSQLGAKSWMTKSVIDLSKL